MAPLRTLAGRILFFFLALFILVQTLAFLAIDRTRMQTARALIEQDLKAGSASFDRQVRARSERFFLAARVLAGDAALREAFGSGHKPTLLAAMANHAARLGADVMLVVSLDGRVLADLERPQEPPAPFPYPDLIAAAGRGGGASALVSLGNRPTQVVFFPLLAPDPAAWLGIGYRLDDALAAELKRLVSLDVSFVREEPGGGPDIVATTLGGARRSELAAVLRAAAPGPDGMMNFRIGGERQQALSRELAMRGATGARVVLQRSLDRALAPFYRLREVQILIYAGGLFAMFAGGVVVSATLTRQLRRLAAGARSVELGDYAHPVPVRGADELAQLAKAFNLMQDAIARREERIRHQASHDELTGLPNRAEFCRRVAGAVAASRARDCPLAIVVMDIERFVSVTAALGHEPGNVVLRKVGGLLGELGPGVLAVARLHSDVFALLAREGTDVPGAVALVREVQRRLETPLLVDQVPVHVEGRFGIVACPAHGEDPDTLLSRVEVAAHLAKKSPGGYAVYSPELEGDSRRHLTLLGELRLALDRDELTMYFQPKVDVGSGRVAGLEALLRWKHAEHGFIPPDEFIGLAEGTGLIRPVTAWTLEAAIRECASLNRRGLALNVAVNLSARMLHDQQLPGLVASLVRRHGVPPGQVTLEITESAIMANPEGALEVVTGLDAAGVRLGVDDFGTGYSSLSYLQRLPVDELKIDKSFVQRMDTNESDAMIVRTIIELGHNLGFEVTAEGVENRATWELLRSHGCDLTQGYLHARPMPVSELLAWAERSPWGWGARG